MQNEAQKERKPGEYEKLTKNISSTVLELSVVLGETRITIDDLLELGKGDVLKLNQSIEEL